MSKKWPAFIITSVLFLFPVIVSASVYDNFNLWSQIKEGTGPIVNEANQRLEITLPATSAGTVFKAGYKSTCLLQGDFDIRVNYSLPVFPASNGVRVSLGLPDIGYFVERTSFSATDIRPAGEAYVTDLDSTISAITTTDTKGKLRLVRTGATIAGYYYDSAINGWMLINSFTGAPTSNVHFSISAWGNDSSFDDSKVIVTFDNAVVFQGSLVGTQCPFAALKP